MNKSANRIYLQRRISLAVTFGALVLFAPLFLKDDDFRFPTVIDNGGGDLCAVA